MSNHAITQLFFHFTQSRNFFFIFTQSRNFFHHFHAIMHFSISTQKIISFYAITQIFKKLLRKIIFVFILASNFRLLKTKTIAKLSNHVGFYSWTFFLKYWVSSLFFTAWTLTSRKKKTKETLEVLTDPMSVQKS